MLQIIKFQSGVFMFEYIKRTLQGIDVHKKSYNEYSNLTKRVNDFVKELLK